MKLLDAQITQIKQMNGGEKNSKILQNDFQTRCVFVVKSCGPLYVPSTGHTHLEVHPSDRPSAISWMKSWPLIGHPIEDTTIKHTMESTRYRTPRGTVHSGSSEQDSGLLFTQSDGLFFCQRRRAIVSFFCQQVSDTETVFPLQKDHQCRCHCRGHDGKNRTTSRK